MPRAGISEVPEFPVMEPCQLISSWVVEGKSAGRLAVCFYLCLHLGLMEMVLWVVYMDRYRYYLGSY